MSFFLYFLGSIVLYCELDEGCLGYCRSKRLDIGCFCSFGQGRLSRTLFFLQVVLVLRLRKERKRRARVGYRLCLPVGLALINGVTNASMCTYRVTEDRHPKTYQVWYACGLKNNGSQ